MHGGLQEYLEHLSQERGAMIAAAKVRSRRADTRPALHERATHRRMQRDRDDSADGAFAGRYRLRRCRGEGGMALVYEAVDLHTGQLVAVKMLRHDLIRNQEARLRFRCEAQLMSRVIHPNVVALLDFGHAAGDRPFLVMEYLEGRSLGEVLGEEGTLSVERACQIGVQASRGLQAAHCSGVIHRDIKPDNLFICSGEQGSPQVKLLDFGISKVCAPTDPLARLIDALDQGRVVGTPHYMAPEQVHDPDNVNEQCDVFSLGVVVCEAVTGVRPHDGKSGGTIIDEMLADPLSAAAAYRPQLEPQLGDVIDPARAYERSERYPSARVFGGGLSALLRALAASSPRSSRPD